MAPERQLWLFPFPFPPLVHLRPSWGWGCSGVGEFLHPQQPHHHQHHQHHHWGKKSGFSWKIQLEIPFVVFNPSPPRGVEWKGVRIWGFGGFWGFWGLSISPGRCWVLREEPELLLSIISGNLGWKFPLWFLICPHPGSEWRGSGFGIFGGFGVVTLPWEGPGCSGIL